MLTTKPSSKTIIRLLVVIIVILALVGGYYHAQLQTLRRYYSVQQAKYNKLLETNESESRR